MIHTDVRPAVKRAVIACFDANQTHAFYTGLGGRFGYFQMVQGWKLPFGLFWFIDVTPMDSFTERQDEVLLQFSVFSKRTSEAESLISSCCELFETTKLTYDTINPFYLTREHVVGTMKNDGNIFHSAVELAGVVETIA